MEELEVVAFACRGTLLDWTGAIEAFAYELARRNGESPLDRGAALRRRVEALADGQGLAHGFDRLIREQGYRRDLSSHEALARVTAMARPLPGAPEAMALAVRSGKRLVAVSRGEDPGPLCLFGWAFDAVVADPREIDAAPAAILYVSSAQWRRVEARRHGMRATAPDRLASALAGGAPALTMVALP